GRGGRAGAARRGRRGRARGAVSRPGRGRGDGVRAMSALEFRTAIRDAIAEELERDPSVIFMGEDIAAAGGVFKATPGLVERFGPERVIDTPISELTLSPPAFAPA